ncbi:hypothetical protein [Roseburia sp. 499]|uniref:hypothetical protein n=1 Tax=Roseburia sp. 499 TaxID=1261634 RepID=UPI000950D328|nr:hypothetical protein [Roseburia sp. 499]WVK69224.1 hypothetical protein BIV20_12715 [Roseburia sp. 499]
MIVTGEALYTSRTSGTSKRTGKPYFSIKFLDENAEEFFQCFVEQELFDAFDGIEKKTPVLLTLNYVPGSKFFSLESLEILEK